MLEANQKFEILTGWARQEVVGRTTMEIALWANEDDRQSTLRLALENGFYDNFETTFRRKDGTLFPVLLSCRLLDINGRKVAVANARDITELHTQRAELRRANDRLARAQALAGLGIWELDTATRGLWWSEETFKLAGMPPGDGTPDFDVYLQTVVEADRALLLRALAEAELHGNAFQVRIRHHRPDGTLNHVVARGEPVLDDGRVVQVLGSVMAIPEPK